jgi:hypothetical protein
VSLPDDPAGWRDWPFARRSTQFGRAVFGDRVGLGLVVLSLVVFALTWRVGIFITDSYAVANGVVNVAAGRLELTEVPYALAFDVQPGLHEQDGALYGRNYGHVYLAVPIYYLLQLGAILVDPRILLAAGWSSLLLVLTWFAGRAVGDARVHYAGVGVAVGLFLANVVTAAPLETAQLGLVAVQLATMAAGALAVLCIYRVLSRFHDERVGAVAGLALLLGTPLWFWASIPKRHVVTAAAILLTVYLFGRSREAETSPWVRAAAWAVPGYLLSVHPLEAVVVLLVLGPVDLLTARANDRRHLARIAVAFGLSVLPFALTNWAISGNPLEPPRLLPRSGGGSDELVKAAAESASSGQASPAEPGGGGSGATPAPDEGGGSGTSPSVPSLLTGLWEGFVAWVVAGLGPGLYVWGVGQRALEFVFEMAGDGVGVLADVDRAVDIFVRSGSPPGVLNAGTNYEAIDLAVLETVPVLGALVVLPLAAVRSFRDRRAGSMTWRHRLRTRLARTPEPRHATDLFVGLVAVTFTLVYLHRLPLHSQITVRYIMPVFPLGVYALARLPPVRAAVEFPRWLAGSFGAGLVLVGGVLWVAYWQFDPAVGEAMQLLGLVGLGAALACVLGVASWYGRGDGRPVAVGCGLAVAAGAVFNLATALGLFEYGAYALGISRLLAGL